MGVRLAGLLYKLWCELAIGSNKLKSGGIVIAVWSDSSLLSMWYLMA